jgi:hypothetical protein
MAEASSTSRKRLSVEERLAALDARRAKLQARLSKARRAEDTRACIILGRWVMEAAKRDPQVARAAAAGLPAFLTREHDRKVMARTLAELQELIGGTTGQKKPAPSTTTHPPRPVTGAPGRFEPRPDSKDI